MKTVLIAADAPTAKFAALALRLRWPEVKPVAAPTVAECFAKTGQHSTDLVLLQPRSQDMELTEAIEEVREFTDAPFLMLSRQDDHVEAVTALSSGADAYIKLPCNLTELAMRIWAPMRRNGMTINQENGAPVRTGELLLNLATREAFLGTKPIHLTSTEFRLMHLLVKNSNSVVSHRTLESTLWGEDANAHGLAKKYVQRLRGKLGDNAKAPRWIACIHGFGYRFIGPPPIIHGALNNFTIKIQLGLQPSLNGGWPCIGRFSFLWMAPEKPKW
jgi:DNA-binding response OmpR family regulator